MTKHKRKLNWKSNQKKLRSKNRKSSKNKKSSKKLFKLRILQLRKNFTSQLKSEKTRLTSTWTTSRHSLRITLPTGPAKRTQTTSEIYLRV